MTIRDLEDAIRFLERSYVGTADQDRLYEVVQALKAEIKTRRRKK
jgi:hypothetical protein